MPEAYQRKKIQWDDPAGCQERRNASSAAAADKIIIGHIISRAHDQLLRVRRSRNSSSIQRFFLEPWRKCLSRLGGRCNSRRNSSIVMTFAFATSCSDFRWDSKRDREHRPGKPDEDRSILKDWLPGFPRHGGRTTIDIPLGISDPLFELPPASALATASFSGVGSRGNISGRRGRFDGGDFSSHHLRGETIE